MMLWYGGHRAWWQGGLMWIGMIVFWGPAGPGSAR